MTVDKLIYITNIKINNLEKSKLNYKDDEEAAVIIKSDLEYLNEIKYALYILEDFLRPQERYG